MSIRSVFDEYGSTCYPTMQGGFPSYVTLYPNQPTYKPLITCARNGEPANACNASRPSGRIFPEAKSTDLKPGCGCAINTEYDVLPNSWPKMRTIGPSAVKHLYTGKSNYYPYQTMERPINTMYGQELSRYDEMGNRESYHFQAYPFHHQSGNEVREYGRDKDGKLVIVPLPNLFDWVNHKVEAPN